MKIEFLTEEDMYVLPFFEELFRDYAGDLEIVRVSCCRAMGNRSRRQLLRALVSLYGPVGFLRLAARHAGSRVLSLLPRRRGGRHYYSIRQLCTSYGVSYGRVQNPNAEEYLQALADRAPDLIVSVACPFILKRRLLETPRLGCINLHNAPLPRYKGMMPTFWQLFHGERAVGLTIHYMNEKIDEGHVLFQDRMDIRPGETLDQLIRRSKRRAAHCLVDVLGQLEDGSARSVPLSKAGSTYFTFPNLDQIREFRRRGLRAI